MNITQSALTRQIQALEAELGVKLFERNKRRVTLTASGKFLRDKYTGIMDEFKFIHQFAKKVELGQVGTIRIAHPDSISFSILPQILKNISCQFPDLRIELVQLIHENEQEFLSEYKIDLAFTRDLSQLEQIKTQKIHTDKLSLVVPQDHFIKTFEDISTDSLGSEKFILPLADNQSSYLAIVQQVFELFSCEPQSYYYSDFGSTIMSLVSNGLGLSVLPYSFLNNSAPGIRFIELPVQSDLYVCWRAEDNNQILKNILDIIHSTLQQ